MNVRLLCQRFLNLGRRILLYWEEFVQSFLNFHPTFQSLLIISKRRLEVSCNMEPIAIELKDKIQTPRSVCVPQILMQLMNGPNLLQVLSASMLYID
jgi:hypothetical protein